MCGVRQAGAEIDKPCWDITPLMAAANGGHHWAGCLLPHLPDHVTRSHFQDRKRILSLSHPTFHLDGKGPRRRSPRTTPCSLPTAPCSLLPAPYSLLLAHCSLLPAPCSLPTVPCSLLLAHCSLPTAPCSLFLAYCPLPIAPCSLPTAHYSLHLVEVLLELGADPNIWNGYMMTAMDYCRLGQPT